MTPVNSPRSRFVQSCCAVALGALAITACSNADSTQELPVATAPPVPPSTTTTTLPPATQPPATEAPVTTEVTTTTEAATTTTAAPGESISLRGDGIGTTFFGAESDGVLAYVESVLGPPTGDTGWVTAFDSPFGVCPGSQVRGVRWYDLVLLFSDVSDVSSSGQHLFHFQYGGTDGPTQPAGITTASGLGIGDSVTRVRELYPDAQVIDDELFGPTFITGDGMSGYLSSAADDGTVGIISGGQACGE
jgi:hypothetical protein